MISLNIDLPPRELSRRILARVRRDLTPPASQVFSKLLATHASVSLLTLNLCPQFGFKLFDDGLGLMAYFMKLGNAGCMVACGAIFLGATTFTSSILLSKAEVTKLLKQWLTHMIFLVGFSLSFFFSVDAHLTFAAVMWWSLGGLLGSYFFLRGGVLLRRAFSIGGQ